MYAPRGWSGRRGGEEGAHRHHEVEALWICGKDLAPELLQNLGRDFAARRNEVREVERLQQLAPEHSRVARGEEGEHLGRRAAAAHAAGSWLLRATEAEQRQEPPPRSLVVLQRLWLRFAWRPRQAFPRLHVRLFVRFALCLLQPAPGICTAPLGVATLFAVFVFAAAPPRCDCGCVTRLAHGS